MFIGWAIELPKSARAPSKSPSLGPQSAPICASQVTKLLLLSGKTGVDAELTTKHTSLDKTRMFNASLIVMHIFFADQMQTRIR